MLRRLYSRTINFFISECIKKIRTSLSFFWMELYIFLMHYSMQFYILYVKLLNHLQQKVINL